MTTFPPTMRLLLILALPAMGFCQDPLVTVEVPANPLELVAGPVHNVETEERDSVLQLLARARGSYELRTAGVGYDVKITFKVNSGGRTEYDGAWQMEELFIPREQARWTASGAAGYSITQISSGNLHYADVAANTIPLRLHEVRGALFDPIPKNASRSFLRTSTATYNGKPVICVLLSSSGRRSQVRAGRRWEEIEDCIDPASGLLQVHSQAPGRYIAYDYADAPRLGDRMLPRQVIITEGGILVTEIHVDDLAEPSGADPNLFVPTEKMKELGPAVVMGDAQHIIVSPRDGTVAADAALQPVCVFGLVAPSGKVVEAHSLQPSDPNSKIAIQMTKGMRFGEPTPLGTRPEQHFVFIMTYFIAR